MKIEVSNGEFVDKLTILEIKLHQITDHEKVSKVRKEYNYLIKFLPEIISKDHQLYLDLYEINLKLWKIEDQLRDFELHKKFDAEFVTLARSVYYTNDERAKIKLQINQLTKSHFEEVKSYANYGPATTLVN